MGRVSAQNEETRAVVVDLQYRDSVLLGRRGFRGLFRPKDLERREFENRLVYELPARSETNGTVSDPSLQQIESFDELKLSSFLTAQRAKPDSDSAK